MRASKAAESIQPILSGPTLGLMHRLDALFTRWALKIGAVEHQYSPLLPVAKLDAVDHFSAFPHQALFAVSMAPDDANLQAFAKNPVDANGHLNAVTTAPIEYCLTPGACFPIYFQMAGHSLSKSAYITTRSPCFRREEHTQPLARQTAFNMREIVCVGAASEVQIFLAQLRERVAALFQELSIPVAFAHATDPFFDPKRSKKYLMQKVTPLKHEMVFGGELAIGSVNYHQNGFGRAFDITCNGEAAHSGCVAFGLERWVYAWIKHFGEHESAWPDLEDKAQ